MPSSQACSARGYDRLTSRTPPGQSAIAYTYDDNGNQLTAGSDSFAWDATDRLVSASANGVTETYGYAGDGRRLSVTASGATTNWWWDIAHPLPMLALERDGTGAITRRSTYGLGRIATVTGAVTAYHHADGLGSVVDLTDPSGDPLAWSEYQPFGAERTAGVATGAPAVPFGFSGEFADPTGLLHLRARQYDSGTGRFLSTDPVAPLLADPYVGTYIYVRNMPTMAVDPSGEFLVLALPAIPAIAGALVATAKAAVVGLAVVGAGVAGAHVGPALADMAKPRYPESEPTYDPRQDPGVRDAQIRLESMLDELGRDDVGGGAGLPGGWKLCSKHRAMCIAGAGILAAAVTLAFASGVSASESSK